MLNIGRIRRTTLFAATRRRFTTMPPPPSAAALAAASGGAAPKLDARGSCVPLECLGMPALTSSTVVPDRMPATAPPPPADDDLLRTLSMPAPPPGAPPPATPRGGAPELQPSAAPPVPPTPPPPLPESYRDSIREEAEAPPAAPPAAPGALARARERKASAPAAAPPLEIASTSSDTMMPRQLSTGSSGGVPPPPPPGAARASMTDSPGVPPPLPPGAKRWSMTPPPDDADPNVRALGDINLEQGELDAAAGDGDGAGAHRPSVNSACGVPKRGISSFLQNMTSQSGLSIFGRSERCDETAGDEAGVVLPSHRDSFVDGGGLSAIEEESHRTGGDTPRATEASSPAPTPKGYEPEIWEGSISRRV